MRSSKFTLLAASALLAAPAFAQNADNTTTTQTDGEKKPAAEAPAPAPKLVQDIGISSLRPVDQRGINIFETPKNDKPFTGFRLEFGAAFTQQWQGLDHENAGRVVNGVDQNRLMPIGRGFNNAVANAYINAQLAKGVRVAMTSYLSSRHHNETWVKDGYLLIDESPIDIAPLNKLMQFVTIRAGHFEINYGDSHFRRTDNGNAMYNPFVGNMILDPYTTEVGGEVYVRPGAGFFAMLGGYGGESRGMVTKPDQRSVAIVSKAGFDRQITDDLRVRLTGSTFNQPSSTNNTLFAGDRAGSRYYMVLEGPTATESANFQSGMINPGFGDKIRAYAVNPFIKFRGLEFFGDIESAKGKKQTEKEYRDVSQQDFELVYRFLKNDKLFVGARYNTVDATLQYSTTANGTTTYWNADTKTTRNAVAGGWFITPTVMLKAEYVTQKYTDFPTIDLRNGGKFNGVIVEGTVAF